jgi:hypothetical protein
VGKSAAHYSAAVYRFRLEASMPDRPESIDRRSFAVTGAAALTAAALPAPLSAQEGGDTLKSELLLDVTFDIAPAQAIGSRVFVAVTGGTFSGPKLKGTALPGGSDAIVRRPDGASILNVRALLKTDDEQLIYMTYDGINYTPPGGKPADLYFRTRPSFETGSARYDWLTRVVCVGVGKLTPGKVSYRVFQIL